MIKIYFKTNNLPILKWPTHFLNINVIKNCWGDLIRAVYDKDRQFKSTD